ncbi:HEAT repeat domain containing protein [Entamoeba marina]
MSIEQSTKPQVVVDDSPLSDRLSSKAWKIRVAAYEELNSIISTDISNAKEYLDYFPTMLTDNNASALETALQTLITYFTIASDDTSISVAKTNINILCEKGLVGRPKAKERTTELLKIFIEIGLSSEVLNTLTTLSKHKNMKLNVESIKTMCSLLEDFGPSVFSLKSLLESSKDWIVHKDKNARQSAVKIVHLLMSNFEKAAFVTFLESIPQAQQRDIEEYIKKIPLEKITPTRTIKNGMEIEVKEQLNDVIEVVTLENHIPKTLDILNALIDEMKSPKIVFPENALLGCNFKSCFRSKHQHDGEVQSFIPLALSKLRESHKPVIKEATETLLEIVHNPNDIVSIIQNSLGNSIFHSNVMKYLELAFPKFNQPISNYSLWASIFATVLEDQRKESRDAATSALLSFTNRNGTDILSLLHGVSSNRLQMVEEKVNSTLLATSDQKLTGHPLKHFPTTSKLSRPISPIAHSTSTVSNIKKKNAISLSPIRGTSPVRQKAVKVNVRPPPKFNTVAGIKINRNKEITRGGTKDDNKKTQFPDLLRLLKTGDWKSQTNVLQDIENYLQKTTISSFDCDALVTELKNKIADPKRSLTIAALNTLNTLIINVKTGIGRYIPTLVPVVISQFGDGKGSICETAIECMQLLSDIFGISKLITHISNSLASSNPIHRKISFELILTSIQKSNTKELQSLRQLSTTVLKALSDRNADVRRIAEKTAEKFVELFGVSFIQSKVSPLTYNEKHVAREILRKYSGPSQQQIIEPTTVMETTKISRQLTHMVTVLPDEQPTKQPSTSTIREKDDVNSSIIPNSSNINGTSFIDEKNKSFIRRQSTIVPPELTLHYKIPETYIRDLLRCGEELLPHDYLQRLVSCSPRDVDLCLSAVANLKKNIPSFEEFIMTWGCILIMRGDYIALTKYCGIVRVWTKEISERNEKLENVRSQTFIESLIKSGEHIASEVQLTLYWVIKVFPPKKIVQLLWNIFKSSQIETQKLCLMCLDELFDVFVELQALSKDQMETIFRTVYDQIHSKQLNTSYLMFLAKMYNVVGDSIFALLLRIDNSTNEYIKMSAKFLKSRDLQIRNSEIKRKYVENDMEMEVVDDLPQSSNKVDGFSFISNVGKETLPQNSTLEQSKRMSITDESNNNNNNAMEEELPQQNINENASIPNSVSIQMDIDMNEHEPSDITQKKSRISIEKVEPPVRVSLPTKDSQIIIEEMKPLEESPSFIQSKPPSIIESIKDQSQNNTPHNVKNLSPFGFSPIQSIPNDYELKQGIDKTSPILPIKESKSQVNVKEHSSPHSRSYHSISSVHSKPHSSHATPQRISSPKQNTSIRRRLFQDSPEHNQTQPPQQNVATHPVTIQPLGGSTTKPTYKMPMASYTNPLNKKDDVSPFNKRIMNVSGLSSPQLSVSFNVEARGNSEIKQQTNVVDFSKLLSPKNERTKGKSETLKLPFAKQSLALTNNLRASLTKPSPSKSSSSSTSNNPALLALQSSLKSIPKFSPMKTYSPQTGKININSTGDWRDYLK